MGFALTDTDKAAVELTRSTLEAMFSGTKFEFAADGTITTEEFGGTKEIFEQAKILLRGYKAEVELVFGEKSSPTQPGASEPPKQAEDTKL